MQDIWYFVDKFEMNDKNNIKGPVSVRDLDVMIRTNSISSNTLAWCEGMTEW